MSCEDCNFPYSLCQCPATITLGELAQLRVDLATARRERAAALRAYDEEVTGRREEVTRLFAELGQLRAQLARPVRLFCAFEDCDGEPDSVTGFCETCRAQQVTP